MTREELLKEYIIKQYGTLQGFCLESGIPKSTLSTVLQRGLGGASMDLIMKICDSLNIDIGKLRNGIIEKRKLSIYEVTSYELELLTSYREHPEFHSAIEKLLDIHKPLPKEMSHEENETESEQ